MFADRSAWFDHELETHRSQWRCFFCPPNHPTFKSQAILEGHLTSHHTKMFAEDQLSAMSNMGRQSPSEFLARSCPFCCDWAADIENRNSELEVLDSIMVTPEAFRRHLGGHMEQLAFFAITPVSDSEENPDSTRGANESNSQIAQGSRHLGSSKRGKSGPGSVNRTYTRESSPEDFNQNFSWDIINALRNDGFLPINEERSNLCGLCAGITVSALEDPAGFRHTSNVWSLLQSAKECALCEILIDAIMTSNTDRRKVVSVLQDVQSRETRFKKALLDAGVIDTEDHRSISLKYYLRSIHIDMELPASDTQDSDDRDDVIHDYAKTLNSIGILHWYTSSGETGQIIKPIRLVAKFVLTQVPPSHSAIPPGLPITSRVELDRLTVLMECWFEVCQSSHQTCNHPAEMAASRPLPTRVLDITDLESTGRMRLWETGHCPGTYITLSYPDDYPVPMKATAHNIRDLFNGFEPSLLPTDFLNAALLAQRLRIHYVWINALCISHDDEQDIKQELGQVGQYYLNSHLNIATLNKSGNMFHRDTIKRVKMLDSGSRDIYLQSTIPGFYTSVEGSRSHQDLGMFQHRVFAPRTLYFTTTCVYWECWHCQWSEHILDNTTSEKKHDYPEAFSPGNIESSVTSPSIPEKWWTMVEQFSSIESRSPADRLSVITKLAVRLGPVTGSAFIEGIWSSDINSGILWTAMGKAQAQFPMSTTPSWSWINHVRQVSCSISRQSLKDYASIRVSRDIGDEGDALFFEGSALFFESAALFFESAALFFEAQLLTLKNQKYFYRQRNEYSKSTLSTKERSLVDSMDCWNFGYAVIRDEDNRYETERNDQDNVFGVICLDAELRQDLNLSDIKWAYVATRDFPIHPTVRTPM